MLAVRAEGHAAYPKGMTTKGLDLFAGFGIPEPDRAVFAAGRDPVAVRAEGDAPDLRGMPAQP